MKTGPNEVAVEGGPFFAELDNAPAAVEMQFGSIRRSALRTPLARCPPIPVPMCKASLTCHQTPLILLPEPVFRPSHCGTKPLALTR